MTARRRRQWFDDDSFWRDFSPAMFTEIRFAEGIEKSRQVLRLTRPRGKDVLDLCCGPGRLSVPLAKRGYRVTGVDRTRFLLNKARARARAAKAKVEWVTKDMRDFVRPDSFDLALNMFTSFGYFADPREDRTVARNVCESLRPGGVFVIELRGKEWIAQHFEPAMVVELPGGGLMVHRRRVESDWNLLWSEWILIRRGRAKSYRIRLRLYSGQEPRDLLLQSGFNDVKLYGDLDGREYGRRADWLVAVARKGRGESRVRDGAGGNPSGVSDPHPTPSSRLQGHVAWRRWTRAAQAVGPL